MTASSALDTYGIDMGRQSDHDGHGIYLFSSKMCNTVLKQPIKFVSEKNTIIIIKKRAVQYRKIPKISSQLNRPSKYKLPGACAWKLPSNLFIQNKTEQKLYSNR